MIVNKISNINFKQYNASREAGSNNAILMLRDPNASVRFQHNQEIARNADAIGSNPLKAIGYKLYKTFSMIKADTVEPSDVIQGNSKNKIQNHINFEC